METSRCMVSLSKMETVPLVVAAAMKPLLHSLIIEIPCGDSFKSEDFKNID